MLASAWASLASRLIFVFEASPIISSISPSSLMSMSISACPADELPADLSAKPLMLLFCLDLWWW